MNENYKLFAAIGQIDEGLILEAESFGARRRARFKQNLTAVACMLVISAGVVGALHALGPVLNPDAGSAAPGENHFSGTTSDKFNDGSEDAMKIFDFGTAELVSRSESGYTLYIELYKSVGRQDVIFRGSGTDEQGEPIFIISTTADYAELTHIPVDPPRLTVNGATVISLPTEPGKYTVEIDVSHIIEAGYILDDYFILGDFGRFQR